MKTKNKKAKKIKNKEELHNDSILWKSEMNFIYDEMRFLEHLLSSQYIGFLDAGLYKKIESFVVSITKKKNSIKKILKLIEEHELMLSNLTIDKSTAVKKNYLETHNDLQREVNNLYYDYREIKKQIFRIVEIEMKNKRIKKLIT